MTHETSTSGVRTYEELDGAEGREVLFRPHRFTREELAPMSVTAALTVGGVEHSVELTNVSQNGASLALPATLALAEGDSASMALRTDGHDAYVGDVRVEWCRREKQTFVGVSFVDGLLDLDEVLQLRDLQVRRRSTRPPPAKAAWSAVTHHRFKAATAEFALFLADSQRRLDDLEKTLSPHVLYTDTASALRTALGRVIDEDVVPGVLYYAGELDAALRLAAISERAALGDFGHRYLHAYLMQAPWMHRAFHKPLGYPGDFEVMNFVYARGLEGATLFAKALHGAFLDAPGAQAVRERKNLTKRELRTLLEAATADAGKPVRILSIAAGPAQELYELLGDIEACPPVEIILFDQDAGALQHAHRRLSSIVRARWADRVKVTYLHDSIKRLLVDPEIFQGRGTFDAILCAGFFDYLRTRSAVKTTATFYRYLKPGGAAYIGNMVPENSSRWLMELHLDWHLIYRSHDEMTAFARAAAPDADIVILEEATKINPFLRVRRPA